MGKFRIIVVAVAGCSGACGVSVGKFCKIIAGIAGQQRA